MLNEKEGYINEPVYPDEERLEACREGVPADRLRMAVAKERGVLYIARKQVGECTRWVDTAVGGARFRIGAREVVAAVGGVEGADYASEDEERGKDIEVGTEDLEWF